MAKKLATQKRRAQLNDYERFQVMVLKRQKSYILNKELAQAKPGRKDPAARRSANKAKKAAKKAKKSAK